MEAAGTENEPQQWMVFIRAVREHMPEVLKSGGTSKQALAESPIGILGFSSWREMLEAPTTDGGLGLNWHKWREWSRSWSVIKELPELHGKELTANQVKRLKQECKTLNRAFPETISAVEELEEEIQQRKDEEKANTLAGLKETNQQLNDANVQLQHELDLKQQSLEAYSKQVNELAEQLKVANQEIGELKTKRKNVKDKSEKLQKMSRWQHFKAIFTGD